jgi:TolB protein
LHTSLIVNLLAYRVFYAPLRRQDTKITHICLLSVLVPLWLILRPGFHPPADTGETVPRPYLSATQGRIAFAAYRNGQWDLYSVAPDGSDLRQLTDDPDPKTDPAWSPDGQSLAFASRRNRNWDIYVLDLTGNNTKRLTKDAHYDGAPAWSPDGKRIAFESYRAGKLGIWVMNADGSNQMKLSNDESAGDFGPSWSPDGKQIAFSSWRSGNRAIWLLDVATGEARQWITCTRPVSEAQQGVSAAEGDGQAFKEGPVWSPDGGKLAFLVETNEGRAVYVGPVSEAQQGVEVSRSPGDCSRAERITWQGREDSPAWSPAGDRLAYLEIRYNGERISSRQPGAAIELPQPLTEIATISGRLSWSGLAPAWGRPVTTLKDSGPSPLYKEILQPIPPELHGIYRAPRMNDLDVSIPRLDNAVDDSFKALRARVREESGRDFLGSLSEALRPYDLFNDISHPTSWHKAGRAFDTLFDLTGPEGQLLYIVREGIGGETFWRVFIRCVKQDGTCGRPMTANPWDWSTKARTVLAPEEGGVPKGIPTGYYIDFTALAREYGWERIPSWDRYDFSWTWHFKAFEYWHFQKPEGLIWYEAMRKLYEPEELDKYYTWDAMIRMGEKEYILVDKGIPAPAPERRRWDMVRP